MAPNGFLRRALARGRGRGGTQVQSGVPRSSKVRRNSKLQESLVLISSLPLPLTLSFFLSFSLFPVPFRRSADHSCATLSMPMKTFHRRATMVVCELFAFANNLGDIAVTSTAHAVSRFLSPSHSCLGSCSRIRGDFSSCLTRPANCRPAQSVILFVRFIPGLFQRLPVIVPVKKQVGMPEHLLCIFGA